MVDTNILISHCSFLERAVEDLVTDLRRCRDDAARAARGEQLGVQDAAEGGTGTSLLLLVPWIVLNELDQLKERYAARVPWCVGRGVLSMPSDVAMRGSLEGKGLMRTDLCVGGHHCGRLHVASCGRSQA